jgi:mutator protein MutT
LKQVNRNLNAASPQPPAIEVAAGLIFRAGRLLITQRPHDGHLGGLWEFPGGKREPDETMVQCLGRELKEELGIEVTVLELIERITHDYPEKRIQLEFYRCSLRAGEPRPLGCPDLRWITRAELDAFEFPAADARLLDRLRQDQALWQD